MKSVQYNTCRGSDSLNVYNSLSYINVYLYLFVLGGRGCGGTRGYNGNTNRTASVENSLELDSALPPSE